MRRITWRTITIASTLVLAPAGARADAVTDWSGIALNTVLESRQSTPDALNTLATVHAAMFETLNFIEARYMPRYVVMQPSPVEMPGDAAAAAAAQHVLVETYPERRTTLDEALRASLEPIDGDPSSSATKILGRSLAAIVRTARTEIPTARAAQLRGAPAIDPHAWNRVLDLVASRKLPPLERSSPPAPGARACAACAVQAAVNMVLRLEFGADAVVDSRPAVIYPERPSVIQVTFVEARAESIAGEELGARIGTYVSRNFYKARN
jgi:hypothetical protein